MPKCTNGFTLIELIMVLTLVGTLAVVVGPRIFATDGFDARGFHDETLAMLRYAQKSAIAQRRPVCVVFAARNAQLKIDADRSSATGAAGCEGDLTGPRGDAPGSITARGSVQYQAVPATVRFDGLGQALTGQTIQVVGAANTITVEAVTGYVRD
ncbi:MAG: type II secretion system GspH family protein [Rhodoferax sp.]|nr:type II secretion system GspH family protein [Rhodoferax sp.]